MQYVLNNDSSSKLVYFIEKPEHKDPSKWLVKSSDHRQTRYDRGETAHNVKKIMIHDDYTTFNRPRPQSYSDVGEFQFRIIHEFFLFLGPRFVLLLKYFLHDIIISTA